MDDRPNPVVQAESLEFDLEELRLATSLMPPENRASISNAELTSLIDRTELSEALTLVHACETIHEPPYDFKICTTHDRTFPLDGSCDHAGKSTVNWLEERESAQRARAVIAEESIAQALALHHPMLEDGVPVGCALCDWEHEDGQRWPCRTFVTLGGKP